jgi:hypothetical protein
MSATTFALVDLEGSSSEFDVFINSALYSLELARTDVGISLTYSTFGSLTHLTTCPLGCSADISFLTIGSRTPAGQMPTTGSATFIGIADGLWVDGAATRRLYGSPATLTANFGTGQLTSILELRGHSDPFGNFAAAPTTVLGTFTGTGTISGATFSGIYGATAGYSGPFAGNFYGPVANEYGLSFGLTGGPGQSVVGVAVGKQ